MVRTRCARGLLLSLILALLSSGAAAHDIPAKINLHAFVKPEGHRLHLVVRVPLVMLLSLNLPKRGPGFLALDHIAEALETAADVTANEIVLFENGERLHYVVARARILTTYARLATGSGNSPNRSRKLAMAASASFTETACANR